MSPCNITVLLCTYISLGLVFVPKVLHIIRVPHAKDLNASIRPSENRLSLNNAEQRRLEWLTGDTEKLKQQIDLVCLE